MLFYPLFYKRVKSDVVFRSNSAHKEDWLTKCRHNRHNN